MFYFYQINAFHVSNSSKLALYFFFTDEQNVKSHIIEILFFFSVGTHLTPYREMHNLSHMSLADSGSMRIITIWHQKEG